MSREMCFASVEDLLSHYASGTWSPVDVTEAMLNQIEENDGKLNAFVFVDQDGARAQAKASAERWRRGTPIGRLDGVPAAVKDNMLMAGFRTGFGCKGLENAAPDIADAPCTARLREAGCVMIGKTTTPEFGWKGVTDSPLTGITRNPWNTERTPGGSSGGSAAAIAAGMVTLATASDGGGSIRIPAGFSGLAGLKPTFGVVPAWPPSPFGALSHVGGLGRTVADCAHMMTVIAGEDRRDPAATPATGTIFQDHLEKDIAGLKVAYSPTLGGNTVAGDVARSVRAAVQWFVDNGAELIDFDMETPDVRAAFRILWSTAAAYRLSSLTPEQREMVDPGLLEIAEIGARTPISDYYGAIATRDALRAEMCALHGDVDLLLTPTLPLGAFEAGYNEPKDWEQNPDWEEWTPFTYPFNMTQQPAMSVPCGLTDEGLPIGLQIIGWRGADTLVMGAAKAYEQSRPWSFPDL